MRKYVDFNVCTAQALDYVCHRFGAFLSADDRQTLLNRYLALPPFPDAAPTLHKLSGRGYSLIAFSNGTESAVRTLLQRAGVLDLFSAIVSVDDVRRIGMADIEQRVRRDWHDILRVANRLGPARSKPNP